MPDFTPPEIRPFPLVGRRPELGAIQLLLDNADAGRGGTLILRGEAGVGKSRLLQLSATEATRREWSIAIGRAFSVESGHPYGLFADAFVPFLRSFTDAQLATASRGAESDLSYLFPMFRRPGEFDTPMLDSPGDAKTRVMWNFAMLLGRVASRRPLLLVVDDLQWADTASLELLHFVARQIEGERIAIIGAYNDTIRERQPQLDMIHGSLSSLPLTQTLRVGPLTEPETRSLIASVFQVDEPVTREFASMLFRRTRGNPFFLEETVRTLATSALPQGGLPWLGWEMEDVVLPNSIRDSVLHRLAGLTPGARQIADLLAVLGTSITHDALIHLTGMDALDMVTQVDELRENGVIHERLDGDRVVYEFHHPLVQETLYGALGLARAKHLHRHVAEGLEAYFAPNQDAHANVLAYHFARTPAQSLAGKAVHYLTIAGRAALATFANREAADYLSRALDGCAPGDSTIIPPHLVEDLGRARQRQGEFAAAIALWETARDAAGAEGDEGAVGRIERRMGLACQLWGRHQQALDHYARSLAAAVRAGDRSLACRVKLAEADCLLEIGRADEAQSCIQEAFTIARELGDVRLLARGHLASLLLHTWTGPPEEARTHGARTLDLAKELEDPSLSCTAHWALTILGALTGDHAAVAAHSAAAAAIAEDLRSPLHRLRVAELLVEYMGNTGDWETGMALGERSIASARALNQRALLARLLIWTGLIHLGRGSTDRAGRYIDEAWMLAHADNADGPTDVHSLVAAHCGRAAFHLAASDLRATVQVCEAGIAIADRTGYTAWAIHRLLPLLAEAHLWGGDLEAAGKVGDRLRRDSERLGHELGFAWATACGAVLVWLRGDIPLAIEHLRNSALRLESLGMVPDAARLRRHLAARLRDQGERDQALQELRRVHETFVRLGAERELVKTRDQIRELGGRPPSRETKGIVSCLSSRELQIARMVMDSKSNKAIARALDISPRTVGTHLTNIFRKLDVGTRRELVEVVRRIDTQTPSSD